MKTHHQNSWVINSPWLDSTKPNLYRDEFQLAKENLPGAYFTPLEPYRWIFQKNGVQLFFRGLAQLAPMFPLRGYHNQISVWTSPPPSGRGNAIYIVMGQDKNSQLRLVGGNYFTEPKSESGSPLDNESFFNLYDELNERDKQQLVRETVKRSIKTEDASLLSNIDRECEHFHTMAIYITALTANGSLFHAGKAVIEGVNPADFSYEFFGEIK